LLLFFWRLQQPRLYYINLKHLTASQAGAAGTDTTAAMSQAPKIQQRQMQTTIPMRVCLHVATM
jgi:hypothetical protein